MSHCDLAESCNMRRPWYSGGTVAAVYPGGSRYDMLPEDTSERFEDGTANFASMTGVVIGLDYLLSIGMGKIEQHVCSLAARLLQRLASLKHDNGEHLVRHVMFPFLITIISCLNSLAVRLLEQPA
jgi:selenocysteine lyase/cysteine desulfurase